MIQTKYSRVFQINVLSNIGLSIRELLIGIETETYIVNKSASNIVNLRKIDGVNI